MPRALTGALVWTLYSLRTQARAIVQELPQGARRLRQLIERDRTTTPTAIQQAQKAATELEKAATSPVAPSPGVQRVQVETAPIKISDYVPWGSIGVAGAIGQFVLILFLVYFLLASDDSIGGSC